MINITKIGPKGAQLLKMRFPKKSQSLLAVTHPNCGHCVSMKPNLDKLFMDLKKYKGDVGVFDIHADALPEVKDSIPALQEVEGFPTIMITDTTKKMPIHYEGDRTSDDMLNFCLKNLNLENILKVYKKNKPKSINKTQKNIKKSRRRKKTKKNKLKGGKKSIRKSCR